ncbi:peroxidase-related enzyme [Patescibacteria group bacterium]|nr:peroxidase-related enzyme [Patescibacteria group bacterium]
MARIKLQDEDTNDPEIHKIFKEIKAKAGKVPAAYRAFARHAHILQANWNRTKNILEKGNIDIKEKEAIATRVSAANECHFCLAIHKGNLEKLGLNASDIQSIEKNEVKDEKLNFVLKFVTTATKNPSKITDHDFEKLKEFGYSEEDIVEILTVMEMYTGYNKIIVALGLQLED